MHHIIVKNNGYECSFCGLKLVKYAETSFYYITINELRRLGHKESLYIQYDSITCEEVIMKEALE